jgi:hypothetical protein
MCIHGFDGIQAVRSSQYAVEMYQLDWSKPAGEALPGGHAVAILDAVDLKANQGLLFTFNAECKTRLALKK